jgi:hypothetical protein
MLYIVNKDMNDEEVCHGVDLSTEVMFVQPVSSPYSLTSFNFIFNKGPCTSVEDCSFSSGISKVSSDIDTNDISVHYSIDEVQTFIANYHEVM